MYIYNLSEITEITSDAKIKGKDIVYTNYGAITSQYIDGPRKEEVQ